jgi:HEAT repeat protein
MRLRRRKKLLKLMGIADPMAVVENVAEWYVRRAQAASALLRLGDRRGVDFLLQEFLHAEEEMRGYTAAQALETVPDEAVVGALIRALGDPQVWRRRAATRTLGWLYGTSKRRRGRALARVLADHAQAAIVRETAAEVLAYVDFPKAVPTLVAASRDSGVWIRFWAVFALGSYWECPAARDALVEALKDEAHPGGSYWPVGLEALGQLRMNGMKCEGVIVTDAKWLDCYGDM